MSLPTPILASLVVAVVTACPPALAAAQGHHHRSVGVSVHRDGFALHVDHHSHHRAVRVERRGCRRVYRSHRQRRVYRSHPVHRPHPGRGHRHHPVHRRHPGHGFRGRPEQRGCRPPPPRCNRVVVASRR